MAFAWSYSRIKNSETCPRRYHEVDVLKNFKEEEGEALKFGNQLHHEFAKALTNNTPLPPELEQYQKWIDRVYAGPGDLYVERKLALTKDFQPTGFFDKNVWYRGIGDVIRVYNDLGLVLDWKTGKIIEDEAQLMLMAQCIFSYFPQVKKVRSEYVWLKFDCSTPRNYDRTDLAGAWIGMLDRVRTLESMHTTMNFPPKPGRLCKSFCPVTSCQFHGKRNT
jgi:hypothetical protein